MPKKTLITFARSAHQDLKDISEYYKGEGVPDAGKRIISDIISQVETLADYPDRGRIVPEFNIEDLRELIRPPYRIVYSRDKGKASIVRIWRSERILKMS